MTVRSEVGGRLTRFRMFKTKGGSQDIAPPLIFSAFSKLFRTAENRTPACLDYDALLACHRFLESAGMKSKLPERKILQKHGPKCCWELTKGSMSAVVTMA